MRACAQLVSYEVAFTLAVIGVIMMAGSLSLTDIVAEQYGGYWYIVPQFLGFLIFFIAGSRSPTARRSTCPRPSGSSSPATTPSTAACAGRCSRTPSTST